MEDNKEQAAVSPFALARRPTYIKINLDKILNNLRIVKSLISKHTEIIAVVKANAYGHGSVSVSRFLEHHNFNNFAVATALEGEELRNGGIVGHIQVLGNASEEDISTLYKHGLIPTVADIDFLSSWLQYCQQRTTAGTEGKVSADGIGHVIIKVDSGMSRNGCQPEELPSLMQFCENNNIPVHSLMTHFAQSWDDPVFTQKQLAVFMTAVQPYREKGVKLHVSNSGAIANNVGVDLDYVRPGISMYGQAPDTSEYGLSKTMSLGYKPALCWMAKASLVHELQAGRVVGYDQTYKCTKPETIATVPIGYADGYLRNMYNHGVLTTRNGTPCPAIGRVSMDAITIRLPDNDKECREFYIIKDNFNDVNSSLAISRISQTIPYEVCTNLNQRVPRLYETNGKLTTSY